MGTINTAIQLANIRSKIDAQQQLVSMLEIELQKAILGDDSSTIGDVLGVFGAPVPAGGAPTVASIYGGLVGPQTDSDYGGGQDLFDALSAPLIANFNTQGLTLGTVADLADETLDQTAIRQMLYQARAMLGELRVEEQHWNQEVNQEKERRKDLGEFAKG